MRSVSGTVRFIKPFRNLVYKGTENREGFMKWALLEAAVKLMNWIRKLIIESKEVCAQSQVPEAAISHPKILLNLLGKGLLRKHSIEKLKVGSSI